MEPKEITPEYLCGYLVGHIDATLQDQEINDSEKIKEISEFIDEAKKAMKIDK